jgi:hypothetical protein
MNMVILYSCSIISHPGTLFITLGKSLLKYPFTLLDSGYGRDIWVSKQYGIQCDKLHAWITVFPCIKHTVSPPIHSPMGSARGSLPLGSLEETRFLPGNCKLYIMLARELNMAGELEIIDRVIAEHQIIRLNLQGLQSSLSDFNALFSLQKAQSGWAQSSVDKLLDQKHQLQDALSRVQKGLNGHFLYEEKALVPLFGEAFMRALIFEHTEIRQQIEQTVSMVNNANLERLTQEDLLAEKSRLQEATVNTSQMIEQHANLEEQMLRMLKKAFQVESRTPRPDQP